MKTKAIDSVTVVLVALLLEAGHVRAQTEVDRPPALATPPGQSAAAADPRFDTRTDERLEREPGDYEHDGFYLRFGLGFGGVADNIISDRENAAGENSEAVVTGVGTVGEFAIGGAVSEGLILGGGIWGATLYSSTYRHYDGDRIPGELRTPENFMMAGFFADWYFSRTSGFHAQAALGPAALTGFAPEQQRYDDDRIAWGGGAMLGIGHEWWVEEQWGLGVLVRLSAAGLVEDFEDETYFHGVATFPGLLLTGTYN